MALILAEMSSQTESPTVSNEERGTVSRPVSPSHHPNPSTSPSDFLQVPTLNANLLASQGTSRTFWSADDACSISDDATINLPPNSPPSSVKGLFVRSRPTSFQSTMTGDMSLEQIIATRYLVGLADHVMREAGAGEGQGSSEVEPQEHPPDYWTSVVCHGLGERAPSMVSHGTSRVSTASHGDFIVPSPSHLAPPPFCPTKSSNIDTVSLSAMSMTTRRTMRTMRLGNASPGRVVRMVKRPSEIISTVADYYKDNDGNDHEIEEKDEEEVVEMAKVAVKGKKETRKTSRFKKTMSHLFGGRKANAGILDREVVEVVKIEVKANGKKGKKKEKVSNEPLFVDAMSGIVIAPASPTTTQGAIRNRASSVFRLARRQSSTIAILKTTATTPSSTSASNSTHTPNPRAARRRKLRVNTTLANVMIPYDTDVIIDDSDGVSATGIDDEDIDNNEDEVVFLQQETNQEAQAERNRRVRRSSSWAGWAGKMNEAGLETSNAITKPTKADQSIDVDVEVQEANELDGELDEVTREAREVARRVGMGWSVVFTVKCRYCRFKPKLYSPQAMDTYRARSSRLPSLNAVDGEFVRTDVIATMKALALSTNLASQVYSSSRRNYQFKRAIRTYKSWTSLTLRPPYPPMVSSLFITLAISTYAAAQYSFVSDPLVDKDVPYTAIPYRVDTHTDGRGPQSGYNICNSTTEGQDSLCQTGFQLDDRTHAHAVLVPADTSCSLADFCIFAPPEPDSLVGPTEHSAVAYCTKPGRGTRLIPEGTLRGVQLVQSPGYIQIVGHIDQTRLNVQAGDDGGELDSGGADGRGNPIGGLIYSNAFPSNGGNNDTFQQARRWTLFLGANLFCIKACDPTQPNGRALCEHIYDRIGCYYNAPSNAEEGVFEHCDGDDMRPVGQYIGPNGENLTWTQPPESEGPITNIPYEPTPAASRNCVRYASQDLYSQLNNFRAEGASLSSSSASASAASGTGSQASGVNPSRTGASGANPSSTGSSNGASVAGVSLVAGVLVFVFLVMLAA
ncbi:hypothetical protein D9758_004626 [Tetrapyrgos nigripes]|uniref:Uncharacterized protein n=1 Tax=Tetrapyrgos nigripes TaxID=182062 RepID=A0A8H5H007_9AGAR|nr:hypothetical protein D9758_004626 [Tetrapyrgos nigripes]